MFALFAILINLGKSTNSISVCLERFFACSIASRENFPLVITIPLFAFSEITAECNF